MNLTLGTGPVEVNNLRDILNGILLAINLAAPGILNAQVGSTGNAADLTDDTTFQYIFPASGSPNAWANFGVGQGVRITAWGTAAANGNNKTFKIFFGSATAITSGVVTINAVNWVARAIVLRSGVSTQKILGEATSNLTPIGTAVQDGTESEAATITAKVTNASPTTGAANDLLTKGFTVEALR